jgi:hypothetical protein
MLRAMRLRAILVVIVLSACGGNTATLNSAQQELDQKHCSSNADCASGLCRAGRCG